MRLCGVILKNGEIPEVLRIIVWDATAYSSDLRLRPVPEWDATAFRLDMQRCPTWLRIGCCAFRVCAIMLCHHVCIPTKVTRI